MSCISMDFIINFIFKNVSKSTKNVNYLLTMLQIKSEMLICGISLFALDGVTTKIL
jgi:hypothetical protein